MGLSNSPLCRWCAAEDETSAHILSECEALTSLRHVAPSWSQRTSRVYFQEPSGTLAKQQGSHKFIWGTKVLLIKAQVHWDCKVSNPIENQSIKQVYRTFVTCIGFYTLIWILVKIPCVSTITCKFNFCHEQYVRQILQSVVAPLQIFCSWCILL